MKQKSTQKNLTDIQDLFKNSFYFFKKHFNAILPLTLVSVGIVLAFGLILGVIAGGSGLWVLLAKERTAFLIAIALFILLGLVLIAALFVFQFLAQATVVWAIISADRNKKVEFKKIWQEIFKKIKSIILVNVLVALAVLGGYILLIIPGLIFGVWFSLSMFLLLIEGKTGREALRASKNLISGYFWPLTFRIVVFTLIVSLVSIAIAAIPFVGSLANMAITLFVLPFSNIYFYFIYKDLKKIKTKSKSKKEVKNK